MTDDSPSPEDDTLPEAEAEARFNRLVGRLVNTPHKPHNPKDGAQVASGQTFSSAAATGERAPFQTVRIAEFESALPRSGGFPRLFSLSARKGGARTCTSNRTWRESPGAGEGVCV
jgi:hypothetical protein